MPAAKVTTGAAVKVLVVGDHNIFDVLPVLALTLALTCATKVAVRIAPAVAAPTPTFRVTAQAKAPAVYAVEIHATRRASGTNKRPEPDGLIMVGCPPVVAVRMIACDRMV